MPDLPLDIYAQILSCIQPRDELSARGCKKILSKLALVSRTLRLICTPRLFESVSIDISVATGESSYIDALCSDDAQARDLAPFIRSVLLHDSSSRLDTLIDSLDAHLGAVQKMPNLQHVQVWNLRITLTIINWCASLSTGGLTLSFEYCRFPEAPLGESFLQTLASVCQQSLKNWHMTSQPDPIQEHLEILIPLPQLTSLSIDHFSQKISLAHLLESLPTLAEFKLVAVTKHQLAHLVRNPLSPSCVPDLKHLTCPSDLLPSFIPFHVTKLQSLNFSDGYVTDSNTGYHHPSILPVQRLISESLEELHAPFRPNSPFPFSLLEALPHLRVLGICGQFLNAWHIEEEEFVEFIRNILTASKVKELRLSGITPSKDPSFKGVLPWQRRVISRFEADFPQLVRISFTEMSKIMWARDQVEKDWRPFLHSAFQHVDFYQAFLSKKCVDYKGHIARQFDLGK